MSVSLRAFAHSLKRGIKSGIHRTFHHKRKSKKSHPAKLTEEHKKHISDGRKAFLKTGKTAAERGDLRPRKSRSKYPDTKGRTGGHIKRRRVRQ